MERKRCSWCNLNNKTYVTYHDEEWGRLCMEESYLFEMLLLECFQAGLSWECVLNKRENFRKAFDGFDPVKISSYNERKVEELTCDPGIIRNKSKIRAAIQNAGVFLKLQQERGSFAAYLESFTGGRSFAEHGRTVSPLSDAISKDLRRRGMKFVGSTTVYAYLQGIGIISSHDPSCFLFEGKREQERQASYLRTGPEK